jgi:hypothetical protein
VPRRLIRRRRRTRHGNEVEELRPSTGRMERPRAGHGAFYRSGPMLTMPDVFDGSGSASRKHQAGEAEADSLQTVLPVTLQVSGKGEPSRDSAKATTIRLEGRTDADFDGGSFETQNVRVSAAEGCDACTEGDLCVRARGILVARYHVTTDVDLPSADDFPDLTPCQRARVQQAIDTVLAPHEQQHVEAFEQYNGVTRTPFDLTLCRSEFDSAIQSMFDDQEAARRQDAQDASDRLDPFHFDVDIDCEEPPEEEESSTDEGGESEADGNTEEQTALPQNEPEPEQS